MRVPWFRHFSSANESVKLNQLIDQYGTEGYGRYWLTLELLAKHWDGSDNVTITLHPRTLAKHLRYNKHTSGIQWVKNGCLIGLWSADIQDTSISIHAPILKELQDKDSRYNRKRVAGKSLSTTLDIDLDKDIDRDKDSITPTPLKLRSFLGSNLLSSEQETLIEDDAKKNLPQVESEENLKRFTPDHFVDLWNECFGKSLGPAYGLGGGVHRDNFLESLKYLSTEKHWRDLFQMCASSPKCMGQNDINWTISPTWIVNPKNNLKVLNGEFDEGKALKALFASMPGETA
jgi:hypothetical protein